MVKDFIMREMGGKRRGREGLALPGTLNVLGLIFACASMLPWFFEISPIPYQ
jgi:hypothetical protein